MKIAVFSTRSYVRKFIDDANASYGHAMSYFDFRLTHDSVQTARGNSGVCVFVNDVLDARVLSELASFGIRLVALRCAGFNNVNLEAAAAHGITICRVPAYSPYAVAEHAVGLILTLTRKFHRAYNRVREGNFALDGLLGFDLHGRTVGIAGMGTIGKVFARIMDGFGCELLANDPYPDHSAESVRVTYVDQNELFERSDIISLHCPLTPETHHLVNERSLARMKDGVMIINTGRGALIDARDIIQGLKSEKVGYLGLDVYEEEADLFFEDLSGTVIQDDVFMRLLTFPNVLITGHQGFFTAEALRSIANTTLSNISAFESGNGVIHEVKMEVRQ